MGRAGDQGTLIEVHSGSCRLSCPSSARESEDQVMGIGMQPASSQEN